MTKPLHVLVTGAGGFSGSRFVDALLARGHRVTALVVSTRGRLAGRAAVPGSLEVLSGDLSGEMPLPPRVDAVIHAAARSQVPVATADRLVRDNVVATQRLVKYAERAGVRRFIYLSSVSVYGRISVPLVDEVTPIVDPDDYGLTKLLGERLLADAKDVFPSLSIRLPGVIGPGSSRNWITTVLESARAGREIGYFNPDAAFNNAAHVDDLAAFICGLLERTWQGAQVVTVAAAGQTTSREAVDLLVRAFGGRSAVRARSEPRHSFLVSSRTAAERFGYVPMEIGAMLRKFAAENAAG